MASDAGTILDAYKAEFEAAFPGVTVRVRKGKPGPGMESPLCGLSAGDGLPAFVLSCQGPEESETSPSFEHVSVRYPINVAYVKDAEANPGRTVEDPDVREKRAAVRNRFYRPRLAGAAQVFHTAYRDGPVYAEAAIDATRVVSEQTLVPTVLEPRGGTV